MSGTEAEKRRWLAGLTARPKLSIAFVLLIFLVLVAGAKVATPLLQATAVVEIRANPLHEQIAGLDSDLVPESITIDREAERLRSVNMALAVLARLPEEEVAAIGTENGSMTPAWLADRLPILCSQEGAINAIVRLLCAVVPAGDIGASAKVAALREALEITADVEQGQISISFSARDPERAAGIANLYAETYVQQRQSEKQRLRQRVVERIAQTQRIIDSVIERPVDDDAAGSTVVASDPLRTIHADPTTRAPRSGPSRPTSSALELDSDGAIAAQSKAARDEFFSRTTPLMLSTAWAEPAAIIRSAASPPVQTLWITDGLALMLAVPVSLILAVALAILVDIIWPVQEHRHSFYDNPFWPESANYLTTPSSGRILINNAEPGRQLTAIEAWMTPATSSSAQGWRIRTRENPPRLTRSM